ncbi:uncharacterized protein PAC_06405 [Phialocephala subalpina]|uniref:DUF6604 domain-containing protein n=1 Tax=Phialocephala subalpina TaxID=576137 RepID=A0A1L7WUR1_9HELO|nr:uncharacterized protein PAC_06405 [Phialocephala subalpina]
MENHPNDNSKYAQYKKATKYVLEWLSQTSCANGYKIPDKYTGRPSTSFASSGRPKGKDRKLAQAKAATDAASSTTSAAPAILLPVAVMLDQARHLSSTKTPTKVPVSVQDALASAIRSRQSFLIGLPTDLKTMLNLPPSLMRRRPQPTLSNTSTASYPAISSPRMTLENKFEDLVIEVVLDYDLPDPRESSSTKRHMTGKTGVEKQDTYELDQSPEDDLQFRVWCFFEDIHHIGDLVEDAWNQNQEGKLDVSIAAIVTRVVLELVQEAKEELLQSAPDRLRDPDSKSQYHTILNGELIDRLVLDMNYVASRHDMKWFYEPDHYVREAGVRAGFSFPFRTDSYLDAITKTIYTACHGAVTVTSMFMLRAISNINRILGPNVKDSYLQPRQQGAAAERLLDMDQDWSKIDQVDEVVMEKLVLWEQKPS